MSEIIKHCKKHGDLTIEYVVLGFNDDRPYYSCRLCRNERAKQYRLDNPEKFSAIKKKCWYKNHEKNIIESKEKYQRHKDIRQKNSLEKYHKDRRPTSNRRLKRLFGLTQDEYDHMEKEQDYKCAICKQPETLKDNKQLGIRKLAVDHCHDTKEIRGLLCFNCNIGIGKFKDSIQELEKAILYLKKYTN